MTTLVTGASGFVGSAVARKLAAAGHRVRVMARKNSPKQNLADLNVEVTKGDLTEPASLREAVQGCEYLFHVAADYRLWVPEPDEIYRSNVTGTRELMLAAADAGVKKIVYTSSVATLGINKDGIPADENTPVSIDDMIGHYKRSKFLAEQEVHTLVREQGLPVIIVNPSTPVGPRDIKPTPTGRLIVDAANGKMPAYVNTGLNIVHVDDVAEGHLAAFERGRIGERYILGGQDMSLKEILHMIAKITGRPAPKVELPHWLIMPIAYISEIWARIANISDPQVTVDGVKMSKKLMYFSSAKAAQELIYRTRPAEEAFRDALAWFSAHHRLR